MFIIQKIHPPKPTGLLSPAPPPPKKYPSQIQIIVSEQSSIHYQIPGVIATFAHIKDLFAWAKNNKMEFYNVQIVMGKTIVETFEVCNGKIC